MPLWKWNIELWTLRCCSLCCSRSAAEVGDGVFLDVRYLPGSEPMAKQSWASTQMDLDWSSCDEKKGIMFLSKSVFKVSPQHTQQDGVSLVNNHTGKSDFPSLYFWQQHWILEQYWQQEIFDSDWFTTKSISWLKPDIPQPLTLNCIMYF